MAVSGFGRLPAAVGLDCGWNLVGKLAFWAMLSEQLRMLPVALSRIVGIGDYSCVVVGKARMTLRESADADQERRRAQVKMGRCRSRETACTGEDGQMPTPEFAPSTFELLCGDGSKIGNSL